MTQSHFKRSFPGAKKTISGQDSLVLRCESVNMSAAVTLALLFFWSVALNEQVTEGCSCLPKHPQQQFCDSAIGTCNTCIANQTRRTGAVVKYVGCMIQFKISCIALFTIPLLQSSFT